MNSKNQGTAEKSVFRFHRRHCMLCGMGDVPSSLEGERVLVPAVMTHDQTRGEK